MMQRGITYLSSTILVIGPLGGHNLSMLIFSLLKVPHKYHIGITSSVHKDLSGADSLKNCADNQGEPANVDRVFGLVTFVEIDRVL